MADFYSFPGSVLALLDPWLDKKSDVFEREKPSEDYLIKFKHAKENSPFCFEIKSFKITSGVPHLYLAFSPGSPTSVEITRLWIAGRSLDNYFTNWLKFLEPYHSYRNPHLEEDPILKHYQEAIYTDFEFLDEDENDHPFDYQTQARLDLVLEHFAARIELLPEAEKTDGIIEVQKEIVNLRQSQTLLPKKEVRKRFSKIIAMLQKQGVKILKEFFDETKKTVYKRILSGQIIDDIRSVLDAPAGSSIF